MPTNPAAILPADARAAFRAGLVTPTSGWSRGYAQVNVLSIPREQAFDLLLFAQRNPKPCPILGVLEAGETTGPLLAGGDIRTDVPKYTVYQDGVKVDEPTDITAHWRDDLVTFLFGCSFTFEAALQDGGVRIAHIDQGVNVPMYRTNRDAAPAGAMSGPLVVSMRPVPAAQVADAVRITSRYPAVHGAPVHVGNPEELGIDINSPDFGDAVRIPDGHLPVFWACGVTPQAAVMQSRPPLAIGHAPGHMLITDARDSDYLVP
ncbi:MULTISPECIES: putative hydro-lyase [unclassified Arthrobacter]|uniref:putative hydro-lyase n=1 Tax=unclassified Arthrobacter TaxID=235627 RepID=UPI0014922522|nr:MULTISPECIES: putative hydro-lyase [unclassified Arthrobacter]MBE0009760.1 putative hydro-lyase [Arthrobacter sp. AET 35A]NOJ63548.1 putative hydro-lyase [Arthrobacter sp. 147(2020)]